jgi:hypothetical protein
MGQPDENEERLLRTHSLGKGKNSSYMFTFCPTRKVVFHILARNWKQV